MKTAITVLTIFPEAVREYTRVGMLYRAQKNGIVNFRVIDLRDFSDNRHNKVDAPPYGGGPGMVMAVEPIVKALESINDPGVKILLSPTGEKFERQMAADFAGKNLTLVCGRYAGVDERVKKYVDRVVSIGDFVLSGGELPALVIAEAAVRLIPGVLGNQQSPREDLGYPSYTRPRFFRGEKVPEVLLSGDHEEIEKYRKREARYGKNNKRAD